jgi:hypothetical protein
MERIPEPGEFSSMGRPEKERVVGDVIGFFNGNKALIDNGIHVNFDLDSGVFGVNMDVADHVDARNKIRNSITAMGNNDKLIEMAVKAELLKQIHLNITTPKNLKGKEIKFEKLLLADGESLLLGGAKLLFGSDFAKKGAELTDPKMMRILKRVSEITANKPFILNMKGCTDNEFRKHDSGKDLLDVISRVFG